MITITIFCFVLIGYTVEAEGEGLIDTGKTSSGSGLEKEKKIIPDTINLKDIKDHWAKSYIEKLVELGSIEGYPDGSFNPKNTITNAEFTKILLASLGHDLENSKSGHWAENYIEEAKAHSVIDEGDFKSLDDPITRGQMAKMIVRASNEQTNDLSLYQRQIKDIDKMSAETKYFVANCYGLGIITGYEDGTFKHERTATRAEASTMIIRLLNEGEREIPKITKDGKWTHKQFVEFLKRKDAYKTVSVFYFEVVEEGKLSFKRNNYGVKEDTIPDEAKFTNLNSIAYNVIKDLTQLAHEGGYYLKAFYNKNFETIIIDFYEEERIAKGGKTLKGEFGIELRAEPTKNYEETKDFSYVSVELGRLWRIRDVKEYSPEYIKETKHRHPDFLNGFKNMIYNVYGEEDGKAIYDYAMKEYDKEYETKGKRENHELINLGNIEARIFNLQGIGFSVTTNIKK